jgi:hypothetical protein
MKTWGRVCLQKEGNYSEKKGEVFFAKIKISYTPPVRYVAEGAATWASDIIACRQAGFSHSLFRYGRCAWVNAVLLQNTQSGRPQ